MVDVRGLETKKVGEDLGRKTDVFHAWDANNWSRYILSNDEVLAEVWALIGEGKRGKGWGFRKEVDFPKVEESGACDLCNVVVWFGLRFPGVTGFPHGLRELLELAVPCRGIRLLMFPCVRESGD